MPTVSWTRGGNASSSASRSGGWPVWSPRPWRFSCSAIGAMKIEDVDACNAGVVFNIAYPGDENFGLWVERSTKAMSYAPWTRCPGPHLQIIEQLKKRFGG